MSVNAAMVENCKKLKLRFTDTFDYAHSHTDGKMHDRILLYPEKTDLEVHMCTHIHTQMRKCHFLWTFHCSVMARLWYRRSHAVMQKWLEPPLSFLHTSLQQYSKLYYPPYSTLSIPHHLPPAPIRPLRCDSGGGWVKAWSGVPAAWQL